MTPCKRHKPGPVERYRAFRTEDGRWAMAEVRGPCSRCGEPSEPRLVKPLLVRRTVRQALEAYGCTPDEIKQYMREHHPEERAREQLSAQVGYEVPPQDALWPFPSSSNPLRPTNG